MFDEINAEGKDVLTDWAQAEAMSGVCVGCIVRCQPSGSVIVVSGDGQPKDARVVAGLKRDELMRAAENKSEALIVFERGDPDRPIVLALMENTEVDVSNLEPDAKQPFMEAVVDGETVKIEGRKQIVLCCGKGSITIRRDGKIFVKGTHLLSRSTGPHRIKGAHVAIN
jgi:hypothetical protein